MSPRSSALVLCVATLLLSCGGRPQRVHEGLSARQILDGTAATYQRAATYVDTGTVDRGGRLYLKSLHALQSGTWDDRFRTRISRDGDCLFEYTARGGRTFTAAGNAGTGTARTPYGPAEHFESWRAAVLAIGAVTSRAAAPATELFFGERRTESILSLRDLERLPDDEIHSIRCAVIRGRTPRQRFTIWIDAGFRMRRVQHFLGAADEPVADVRYTEVTIR
ncbi:MAG: hypothetical protein QOI24_2482 [Acidobacteriota bacterium]|jgi:hypothetical protein|nr:hypothetical protein [Acidobacteriota bacterium]